jgi:Fic family protein
MTAKLNKILAEIDTRMLEATREFNRTREEKEAIFGGKLSAPKWVRVSELKAVSTDITKLVEAGKVEHDTANGRVRRIDVPAGYYESSI